MSRSALVATPLALVIATTLAGCSDENAGAASQIHPLPSSTSGPTSPTSIPPVYNDGTPQPAPEASTDAQDTALSAAAKIVRTYAQPDLTTAAWAQQMTPLLSQSGAIAYEGQDPTTIPARKVTGRGKVLTGATDVALTVLVPTDAGDYTVALSRQGDTAPWLADEIRPSGDQ